METINYDDFLKVQIMVGTVLSSKINPKAKKPAYILEIDFGAFGIKTSSAQLTEHYRAEQLIGRQVLAVVNFPNKKIAGIDSEVLVLAGVSEQEGTILIQPEQRISNGTRIL